MKKSQFQLFSLLAFLLIGSLAIEFASAQQTKSGPLNRRESKENLSQNQVEGQNEQNDDLQDKFRRYVETAQKALKDQENQIRTLKSDVMYLRTVLAEFNSEYRELLPLADENEFKESVMASLEDDRKYIEKTFEFGDAATKAKKLKELDDRIARDLADARKFFLKSQGELNSFLSYCVRGQLIIWRKLHPPASIFSDRVAEKVEELSRDNSTDIGNLMTKILLLHAYRLTLNSKDKARHELGEQLVELASKVAMIDEKEQLPEQVIQFAPRYLGQLETSRIQADKTDQLLKRCLDLLDRLLVIESKLSRDLEEIDYAGNAGKKAELLKRIQERRPIDESKYLKKTLEETLAQVRANLPEFSTPLIRDGKSDSELEAVAGLLHSLGKEKLAAQLRKLAGLVSNLKS